MSFRRVGCLVAMFVANVLWTACGDIYRPVVIPIANNPPNPANFHSVFAVNTNIGPNPGTALQIDVSGDSNIGAATLGVNPTHAVVQTIASSTVKILVASAGSVVNGNADIITSFSPTNNGLTAIGIGSTVTYSLPNVGPSQSSAITAISESGNVVTVTLAAPIAQATVGAPIVISGVFIPGSGVPNPAGYDGNFTISSVSGNTIQYTDPISGLAAASGGTAMVPLPTFCSYQPDFVASTQSNAAYVANYGQENGATCSLASTDSVAALNTSTSTIARITYLPAGSHPILMVETPNGQNLYVVNQGDGVSATSVLNLSTIDLSTTATIPIGINPAWIASRLDGQRVYVLTQGDSQLFTIRADNTVSAQTVGVAPNYILYDKNLNRLYVTAPAIDANSNGAVYVFSATGDLPAALPIPTQPVGTPAGALAILPAPPCAVAGANCGPVIPISVAALPDGSRFYVASYQRQQACSDPYVGAVPCITPMVTIFDARNFTLKAASSSYFGNELSLLSAPPFGPADPGNSVAPQYAVPELTSCIPAPVYSPASTRFRMFATAAADSSRIYVSVCDAGVIAAIDTTTNTVSQGTNEEDRLSIDLVPPFSSGALGANNQPPPQSPVFLLTAQ